LRFGIVPVKDAENLTIGLEIEKTALSRAIDRSYQSHGDSLAILADYGMGKSHFIELAKQQALRENFLVATASLDLAEVPPNKAQKIYEALVTSLHYPETDEIGLAPLLRKAVHYPEVLREFIALSPRGIKNCPLAAALNVLPNITDSDSFKELVMWLSGQMKPQTNLKRYLSKPPPLYTIGENARQYTYLLSGLAKLATMLGYQGLGVLIDESEHYSLLKSAQREKADSFFKAMVLTAMGEGNGKVTEAEIPKDPRADYPVLFAAEPHILFIFTLTQSDDRMPITQWLSASQIIRLDDRFIEKDVLDFFLMVLRYHASAFQYKPSQERYERITRESALLLSRGLNQRRIILRELIRTAVTLCDLLHLYNDYPTEQALSELRNGLKV
jgi:hypothetical protein